MHYEELKVLLSVIETRKIADNVESALVRREFYIILATWLINFYCMGWILILAWSAVCQDHPPYVTPSNSSEDSY